MPAQNPLPRGLLDAPVSERLDYFINKVVRHAKLDAVEAKLLKAIQRAPKGRLILVIGPTGVGKSTLLARLLKRILDEYKAEMEKDVEFIPAAALEVLSPENGSFNWRDFYIRLLITLLEILVDDKISPELLMRMAIEPKQFNGKAQQLKADLATARLALEQCLVRRRPKVVFLDEAQGFTKVASGHRLLDQMETLKSVSNRTKTVLALVGTYDLRRLVNLNGQLSRRAITVHFPRYRPDKNQDVKDFKNVLYTFQINLPLQEQPDLVAEYDYLYENCVGCVRVLKTWLDQALAEALEEGEKKPFLFYLKQCAMPVGALETMASDINRGEGEFTERKGQRNRLRELLGIKGSKESSSSQSSQSSRTGKQAVTEEGGEDMYKEPAGVPAGQKKNRRPGRNPQRDRVGFRPEGPGPLLMPEAVAVE